VVRVLTVALLVGTAGLTANAAEIVPGHAASVGVDVGYVDVSAYSSWTEGSAGKLRYGDSGFTLNRAFIDYRGRWTDTLHANIVLEAYDDDIGNAIDFTQAYLEWRPVPGTATRYRAKLGAFYPPISLENVDAAWSSPYTASSSAINSWIAEEIRTLGAELAVTRRPASLGGAHAFSIEVAAFQGNDPAGSLLAWKGWSVHDRQSRFNDELPLPPLPQIQPGMMFEKQDPWVAPFREVDGRTGYYTNVEWRYAEKLLLRTGCYDNRADPTAIEDGQYAWYTEFTHAGLQTTFPGAIGLVAQWMTGATVMGPRMYSNGAHAVDAEYESYFALLSKAYGRHRWSFRYDNFAVSQSDQTPQDNNAESGHASTLAYQVGLAEKLSLVAEWISIKTHRPAWSYFALAPGEVETQFQLTLRLRL